MRRGYAGADILRGGGLGLLAKVLCFVFGGAEAVEYSVGVVGGRCLGEARQGYMFCSWTVSGLNLKLAMGIFCRTARPSEEFTDNTMYWSLALLLERSDLMKTA